MSTGSSTSIYSTYILFLTKLHKRQIPEKGFAQTEKRYHTIFYRHETCVSLQKSKVQDIEKAGLNTSPAIFTCLLTTAYFLNFLRPNPASPISPEPKRSMVAGSGTGFGFIATMMSSKSRSPLQQTPLLKVLSLKPTI